MKVVGIDPGINGPLAIVEVGDEDSRVIEAIDVPTVGVKAKQRVDVIAVQKWLLQHAPRHAYLERSQAMPAQGASSGFKYGVAIGMLFATVMLCGIPLTIVEPAAWKRGLKLRGREKEASRQRALELFPEAHRFFARRKDHNRAESH